MLLVESRHLEFNALFITLKNEKAIAVKYFIGIQMCIIYIQTKHLPWHMNVLYV